MKLLRSLLLWPFRKWWRAIPTVLLLIAAVWFGIYSSRRARLEYRLERLWAERKAAGDPVHLRDFANGAKLDDPGVKHFLRSLISAGYDLRRQLDLGRDVSPDNDFRAILGDWRPATPVMSEEEIELVYDASRSAGYAKVRARVLALLEKYRPALDELELSCAHPPAPLPNAGAEVDEPTLWSCVHSDFHALFRLCQTATRSALSENDGRKAARYALLGLRLVGRISLEPEVYAAESQAGSSAVTIETIVR
ncbi:MAG TPA: hypothetical protein VNC50_21540, partial [Planctomycetia bacterium]|nr:hypothetical protein [Planctomycetia bacterium]